MSGPAAFLAARRDEDEAAAKAAVRGPWRIAEDEVDGKCVVDAFGGPVMAVYGEGVTPAALPNAAHIARHDPARVLREVTAMRAILAEHAPYEMGGDLYCAACGDCPQVAYPCTTLLAVLAVHSDHPDYRQEWAG